MKEICEKTIKANVASALKEDIGTGDITGKLIPKNHFGHAKIITRESGVLCGQPWVDETFHAVSSDITIKWNFSDGNVITANDILAEISGPTKAILTAERTALNFLQILSGTASISRSYSKLVQHRNVKLLDTRKTIPGLRIAQKYAVSCGGCENHRMGLFDEFLLKENHISACQGIEPAVLKARDIAHSIPVEVEVENLEELVVALKAGCDRVMLDNFDLPSIKEAVRLAKNGKTKLEASGNISLDNLEEVASTGVDFISIGALTKNCHALDLSLILS